MRWSAALTPAIVVGFAAIVGGCAGAGLSPQAVPTVPLVIPLTGDATSAARAIAALARDAGVLYLGEQHDNPSHHARQRQVIEALLAEGARPALAFEMLDESQQAAVARAVDDRPTAVELERALGWRARGWPDFSLYWPLFELAARERLPVVALDLDPAVARRIARDGLAALGPRARDLASMLSADPVREAAIAHTIREGHCGLLPESRLPSMVEAWHARNATMARRLAAALDRGRPVVVIVGRGHQDAGGLPAQLARLRPGVRQVVVSMVEERGALDSPAARAATADVVWMTPAVERADPCAPLRGSSR